MGTPTIEVTKWFEISVSARVRILKMTLTNDYLQVCPWDGWVQNSAVWLEFTIFGGHPSALQIVNKVHVASMNTDYVNEFCVASIKRQVHEVSVSWASWSSGLDYVILSFI